MGLRQRAVTSAAWSAMQNWGTTLIAALVFMVLARLVEPEAFGLLAAASACIAIT